MPRIKITIAICTWNRSSYLRATLTSLRQMEAPTGIGWDVLVVNNNCTDDTEAVIESFVGALPIRSVIETRQGLSHARNRAVEEAPGDYIIWTDDDVIVGPQWLAAYANAFRAWPEAVLFGGPIIPQFDGTPPTWLMSALQENIIADVFAVRDLGVEPTNLELNGNKIPYGANFAVRTQEQRLFSYDPNLGLHARDSIRGEETELVKQVLNSGAGGRWVPGATVRHVISKDRQTVANVRYYFVGQGRTHVRKNCTAHASLGEAGWLWCAAIVCHLRYSVARIIRSPEIWCRELRRASFFWGQIIEHREVKRRA